MLKPGDVIAERFRVEALLGQGGLARVYLVRHLRLGTLHALKLLTISRERTHDRLLLEGRIQARLRHPNVVAVTDVVEHEGMPALVMEYVGGESLDTWLARRPDYTLDDVLALFAQILAGVGAAHAAGVLHRDLKPANVMLAVSGAGATAKVADFGIAKVAMEAHQPGLTADGVPMGTPGYMAPEQLMDSAGVDARADIFALGAVLYELITRKRAFLSGDLMATITATATGNYTPTSEIVPDCPGPILVAIQRALEPDPEDRFPDCEAFARALYADNERLLAIATSQATATGPLPLPALEAPAVPEPPPFTDEFSTGSAARVAQDAARAAQIDQAAKSGATQIPVTADDEAPPAPLPAPSIPPRRGLAAGVLVGLLLLLGIGGAMTLGGDDEDADAAALTPAQQAAAKISGPVQARAAPARPAAERAAPAREDEERPEGEGDEAAGEPEEAAPDEEGAVDAEAGGAAGEGASAPTLTTAQSAARSAAPQEPEEGAAADEGADEGAEEEADEGAVDNTPEAAEGTAAPEEDAVASLEVGAEGTAAPPEAAPVYPDVSGTWQGQANNRPLVLRVLEQESDRLVAEVVFTGGSAERSIQVVGRVDAAGNLSLQEPGGAGLTLTGMVAGGSLSGAYMRAGQRKSLSWSAQRSN